MNDVISPEKACKIIACAPARKLWTDIYWKDSQNKHFKGKYFEINDEIVRIETMIFKKKIYTIPSVVVRVAIYMICNCTQKDAAEFACNNRNGDVSLRNLMRKLGLKKRRMWNYGK